MDTVRDSSLGQLLRWVTRNRILLYPEEKPGFVFKKEDAEQHRLEKSKSHRKGITRNGMDESQEDSLCSSTRADLDGSFAPNTTARYVADWYGADDPSCPRNWSPLKKRMVAFQIWYNLHSTFVS
jgi:DHA1 family multidrug resistance protein-like MFS transporter